MSEDAPKASETGQEIDDEYVPSWRGEEILGIKRNAFFYLVNSGQVKAEEGRDRKDGRYRLADILHVKKIRKDRQRKKPFLVDWMSINDLPDAIKLDLAVYKEVAIGDFNLYRSWLDKNPHIAACAFDRHDRRNIWAYIALLPVREDLIFEIISGKKTENDITADDILTNEDTGPRSLLAISVVALPDHRVLLYFVLDKIMDHFVDLYPSITIQHIYAQAASPEGDILMQKLHFSDIYVPSGGVLKHIDDAYVLNLERPGSSRTIREYQKRLIAKGADLSFETNLAHSMPDLPASIIPAQSSPSAAHRQPSQPVKHQSSQSTLPDGLIAYRAFASLHNIPGSTVGHAIERGELSTTQGAWKSGQAVINHAFNAEQRTAFYAKYSGLARFKPCANCPHL